MKFTKYADGFWQSNDLHFTITLEDRGYVVRMQAGTIGAMNAPWYEYHLTFTNLASAKGSCAMQHKWNAAHGYDYATGLCSEDVVNA